MVRQATDTVLAADTDIVGNLLRPETPRDPYGVDRACELLGKTYHWPDGEMASRTRAAGNAFSMTNCAAAPALFHAYWVHPFAAHPNPETYHQRLLGRPSFARAVEEARPYRCLFPSGAPTDRG